MLDSQRIVPSSGFLGLAVEKSVFQSVPVSHLKRATSNALHPAGRIYSENFLKSFGNVLRIRRAVPRQRMSYISGQVEVARKDIETISNCLCEALTF